LAVFSAICICVTVVLMREISRKNSKRSTKDVKETNYESCSSGGFSSSIWENEDNFQHIEMR
jgi:hypothetical protein